MAYFVMRAVLLLGFRCIADGAAVEDQAEDQVEFGSEIANMFAQPISFNMGPFVDAGGEDPINLFDPSPLDFLGLSPHSSRERMHWLRGGDYFGRPRNYRSRDLYKEEFRHFVKHHMSSAAHPKTFEVRRTGNVLHLQLSIPKSKFHKPGDIKLGHEEKQVDQPLIVAVVGRSLVIQVQRASAQTVKSSQRSFELPESANTDAIQAVFDAADGMLSVEIPLKNLHQKHEHLELLEDGSQTTVTFAHAERARDEDLQMLSTLANFLPGHQGEIDRSGDVRPSRSYHSQKSSFMKRKPRCGRKSSSKLNHRVPIAVQPKNAKPFWRLVDGDGPHATPAIEIVAPRGVDLGTPNDGQLPVYNQTGSEFRGVRLPIGQVKLPVQVSDSDCAWMSDSMPVWMVGLVASLTASAAMLLAVAIGCGPGSFTRSGLKITKKPCTRLQFIVVLLTCAILLGAALSVYLAHQQNHEFDERSLRCSIGHDAMRKINVRMAGEL